MASVVRTAVLQAIKDGYVTNTQIAEATGIAQTAVATCTRRLVLDGAIVASNKDTYKHGPGSQHYFQINEQYDGQGWVKDYDTSRIPPPDPVLAAFFGMRVKCVES